MSAPALFEYDRPDQSSSAPPWMRRRDQSDQVDDTAERVVRLSSVPPAKVPHGDDRAESPRPLDLDAGPIKDEAMLRAIKLRRSLEPQAPPPPPIGLRAQGRIRLARNLGLSAAFAALAAFAMVTLLAGPQQTDEGDNLWQSGNSLWARVLGFTTPKQSMPVAPLLRLAAQNRVNFANRPIPLGVSVTAPAPGASVVLAGLADGTRLSAGEASGANGWRIAARDLDQAMVVPPSDFVGAMDLAVDLRLANDAIADSNVVRLAWAPTITNVEAKADREVTKPAPSAAPTKPTTEPAAAAAPVARDLGHDEITALLKRGKDLISRSDISAARLVLRRVAEGGSARAAFALAASYDPAFLKDIGVIGANPDIAKARAWYAKAAALGSEEAPRHLERLAQQAR